jgi:hypothetical protein
LKEKNYFKIIGSNPDKWFLNSFTTGHFFVDLLNSFLNHTNDTHPNPLPEGEGVVIPNLWGES